MNWFQRKIRNLGEDTGLSEGSQSEFRESNGNSLKAVDVENLTESYQLSTEEEKINKGDDMIGIFQENDWNISGWGKILGKNKMLKYFVKVDKKWGLLNCARM